MAKKRKSYGAKDSGISDLNGDLVRKVRKDRGSVPVSSSDDYTPITNLSELGQAISAIKRGQDRTAMAVDTLSKTIDNEIKPKLDQVRDGFLVLETEHRTTKKRLRAVETDTKDILVAPATAHDCYHEDDIKDLEEGGRRAQAEIAEVKINLAAAATEHKRTKEATDKDVARIDGRAKTVTGITVTVIIFVLGIAGTAAAGFYTVQAAATHNENELSKVRDEVSKMRTAHVNASSKVQSAAVTVEKVAKQQAKNGNEHMDPLEALWCDLSPQERSRQERLRGRDKIPQRRCP